MGVIIQALRSLFSWFLDRGDRHLKTFHTFEAFEKFVDDPPSGKNSIAHLKIQLERPRYYHCSMTDIQIPTNIDRFSRLKILSVTGCGLTVIPWTIGSLKQLQVLDLSYNWLSKLPSAVGWLPKLEELNLESNMLVCLPTSFLYLGKLKKLNVEYNNQLIGPTYSCCAAGLDAVRKHLVRRLERRNLFEKYTVFYESKSSSSNTDNFPMLLSLSVECILRSGQDFLSPPYVPPRLKQYLQHNAEHDPRDHYPYMKITKCSDCRSYFSDQHRFEAHECKYERDLALSRHDRLSNFTDHLIFNK